ncbi:MAG: acetolactate synthase large subunit [Burkholderiales bacterium]|nr:acetolactate synthase large subunit [Burkholderiales bacterium]
MSQSIQSGQPIGQRYGAHAVVDALVEHGVDTFFANPGTSEIHLVAALDANPRARSVLCLFEGVATGAADGYARAAGRPAAVLLHLGPGLANGLANLHNASKANSPMVVIVGEHATAHLRHDTPLRSDLSALAGYAAKAVYSLTPGDDLRATIAAAVACARQRPAGPVVVIANADVMWAPASTSGVSPKGVALTDAALASAAPTGAELDTASFDIVLQALGHGASTALVLGGDALLEPGLVLADRIAQVTGCQLFCETFNARHERGAGVPSIERIPYFRETAVDRLAGFTHFVLAGSRPPVAFFASPGERSELTPPGARLLRRPTGESPQALLAAVAARLADDRQVRRAARRLAEPSGERLNARAIWAVINRHLPAGAIVADEAGVTSVGADQALQGAERHLWLNLTGGSIGQGLPLATGAALARPEATVLAVHGDGGALYTPQALWTQAREQARVVNLIFRNDRYAILDHEVKRHGLAPLGERGAAMFELARPGIDWVKLAGALGMPAESVDGVAAFDASLAAALRATGPVLIELRLGVQR